MVDISILGCGLACSLGLGVDTVFDRMLAGHTGLRTLTRFPTTDLEQKVGGQLTEADEAAVLDRFAEDDLAAALIKQAAAEAVADEGVPGSDCGLVLATNFGLMETLNWAWRERLDTGELDDATFDRQQQVVADIARHLGIDGPRAQLSLSCASGAAAIALAREWLLAGRVDRVLAIGYDVLTEYTWCGLANLRTITSDSLRPFDRDRNGTIFSEGAAAMLLSRREVDRAKATGFVLGAATNNNAFHLTAPTKDAAGSRRVMTGSLADAGMGAEGVDMVSAHATGTSANDPTESAALVEVLEGREVPVCAFKSSLGHLLGAAGLAEAVIGLRALQRGLLPPVIGLEHQDDACPVQAVKDQPLAGEFRVALTNSAGLGGNNASLVLAKSATPAGAISAPTEPSIRLVRVGWVLPGSCEGGDALPGDTNADELLTRSAELKGFSAKPYLESVKGYLDPAGNHVLAAAAQCLGTEAEAVKGERFAVVAATQYGAPVSASKFFELMVSKGPRHASPLIFPHGYANTAPNLAAIEFDLGGPHLVFDRAPDLTEATWAALNILRRNQADDVLLIAYEAVVPRFLPDGREVLDGAICWWLSQRSNAPGALAGDVLPGRARADNLHGTVHAALHSG